MFLYEKKHSVKLPHGSEFLSDLIQSQHGRNEVYCSTRRTCEQTVSGLFIFALCGDFCQFQFPTLLFARKWVSDAQKVQH